ncbi:MAG: hypothetical protein E7571_00865 [Ruminococcaceae bacterium]|nr:hypothetical protein [Oscillospiraceae bacterium]
MNSFTFDGRSSADFGLYISKKNIYSAPARDMQLISVPGRNGDVLIDNGRYENVDVLYTIGTADIKSKIKEIKTWLCRPGYFDLTDTYQPEYVRKACFNSSLDVEELLNNVGTAAVRFSCKPFMYLRDSFTPIELTSATTVVNPEAFESLPIIKLEGSGNLSFYINGKAYTVNGVEESVVIDSELMTAYSDDEFFGGLMNGSLSFTRFPVLEPGDNLIRFTSNVTKLSITPRFRTL